MQLMQRQPAAAAATCCSSPYGNAPQQPTRNQAQQACHLQHAGIASHKQLVSVAASGGGSWQCTSRCTNSQSSRNAKTHWWYGRGAAVCIVCDWQPFQMLKWLNVVSVTTGSSNSKRPCPRNLRPPARPPHSLGRHTCLTLTIYPISASNQGTTRATLLKSNVVAFQVLTQAHG